MHVRFLGNIGHRFSQRRKTHKPRGIQICEAALPGYPLSHEYSFSPSTFTDETPSVRMGSLPGPGALNAHPTFQPQPRLYDQPSASLEQSQRQPTPIFFHDSTNEEYNQQIIDGDLVGKTQKLHSQLTEKILPPRISPMEYSVEPSEPEDYFMVLLVKRPHLPRSTWSESTIRTPDQDKMADSFHDETVVTEADMQPNIPNFSHKRNVTPKRPPLTSLGLSRDYAKRSAWKRRGVLFSKREIYVSDA